MKPDLILKKRKQKIYIALCEYYYTLGVIQRGSEIERVNNGSKFNIKRSTKMFDKSEFYSDKADLMEDIIKKTKRKK